MSLEALGNVGEFVGALAVVLSLLYLAAQMRQNSQLVRASTYQSGADWTLAALTTVAQSPETARVFAQGLADPQELSDAERVQFSMIMNMIFTGLANQFGNYQRGAVLEEQWSNMERIGLWYMSLPGVQRWLRSSGNRIDPGFLEHMRTLEARATAQQGV